MRLSYLKFFGTIVRDTTGSVILGNKILQTNLVHKPFLQIRNLTGSVVKMSKKRALVVIAHGSEEIESVTPIDVLRRAGVEVTVAGLDSADPQVCSRQVVIGPETALSQVSGDFDAILLPGGLGGAEAFCNSEKVGDLLKEQEKAGRIIASICAGPTALKKFGIGLGKSVTSYPAFKDAISEGNKYTYKEDRVVVDGNIITSRGPGTAMEWALVIAEHLVGKEKADEVAKGMLFIR